MKTLKLLRNFIHPNQIVILIKIMRISLLRLKKSKKLLIKSKQKNINNKSEKKKKNQNTKSAVDVRKPSA